MKTIQIEVSPGELIDKITILRLKVEQLPRADQRANAKHELDILSEAWSAVPESEALDGLVSALSNTNRALWLVEDAIRRTERQGEFEESFVALARTVYRENDRRAAIKRQINELLGADIVEEKSYLAPETRPEDLP